MLIQDEKKHNLRLAKAIDILSKLVSNVLQPMTENKTSQKAQIALHERFQYIDVMSTSEIIYEATLHKLSDFINVTKYTSSYQATFNKIGSLLTDSSLYTQASTEVYLQASMLMNIGSKYSALVSSIQKEWKTAETTNVPESIFQIIHHFEFMKRTTKNKVLLVSTPFIAQQTLSNTGRAPKSSCIYPEYIVKTLDSLYQDVLDKKP